MFKNRPFTSQSLCSVLSVLLLFGLLSSADSLLSHQLIFARTQSKFNQQHCATTAVTNILAKTKLLSSSLTAQRSKHPIMFTMWRKYSFCFSWTRKKKFDWISKLRIWDAHLIFFWSEDFLFDFLKINYHQIYMKSLELKVIFIYTKNCYSLKL